MFLICLVISTSSHVALLFSIARFWLWPHQSHRLSYYISDYAAFGHCHVGPPFQSQEKRHCQLCHHSSFWGYCKLQCTCTGFKSIMLRENTWLAHMWTYLCTLLFIWLWFWSETSQRFPLQLAYCYKVVIRKLSYPERSGQSSKMEIVAWKSTSGVSVCYNSWLIWWKVGLKQDLIKNSLWCCQPWKWLHCLQYLQISPIELRFFCQRSKDKVI